MNLLPKLSVLARNSAACLFLILSILPTVLTAQKTPEIQAIQDKMSRGEKPTPEEQKMMDDYLKSQSDKLDKLMEKLKNIKPKTVDLSKPVKLPEDEYLPKQNAAAHYNNAVAPTLSEYLALVKKYNDASGEQVADIKSKLGETFAQLKTANDFSNLGMLTLMSASPDKDESATALYEVTAGAAKDPKDGNIANNFGVLLKNSQNYEDSLKVLLYAEKTLQPNAVTETNLGWTIAYLGDFFTAKTKFQKAINLDAYDQKACEGMGLLFRVEGNIPESSKYLRMSLKLGFSASAANNLAIVESKVDGLIAADAEHIDEDSTNGIKISDVLQFPYTDGQNSKGSGSGKLQFAKAPDFFNVSLPQIAEAEIKGEFLNYDLAKKAEFKSANDALYEAQQQLAPISPAPIRDGETVIYPRSYEPEVFALVDLERIFARRYLVRSQKFEKRFQNEVHLPVNDKFFALEKQSKIEYQACGGNNSCERAVDSKFCNLKKDNIKGFNGQFQTLWTKYVQAQRDDLKSYYDFAAPWLREIKDAKLNQFMNQRREFFIRASDPIEEKAGIWEVYSNDVGNNWSNVCPDPPETDHTPPADLGEYRKLKVFPEPYGSCHVPQYKYAGGIGVFGAATEATCDSLKVEFSVIGIYGGVDRKFGASEKDDVTTLRFGYALKSAIATSPVGGATVGVKFGDYVSFRDGAIVDSGVEATGKIDGSLGNANVGNVKNQIVKLESIQISGESGPRTAGNPAVKFNSVLDNLDK